MIRRRTCACALSLAVLAAASSPAYSTTYTFMGPSGGAWSDHSNWSPNVVPLPGGDVIFFYSDIHINFDYSYAIPLNSLTLDRASGFYQTTVGTNMIATSEYIGIDLDYNFYIQSAGTNTTTSLFLGRTLNPIGDNAYYLSGTATLNATFEYIGLNNTLKGQNVLSQTGGINNATTIHLGSDIDGIDGMGTYNLSGGTVTTASLFVGKNSNASTFNQSGSSIANVSGTDSAPSIVEGSGGP